MNTAEKKQSVVKKQLSNVEVWLGLETDRVRKALESASGYFDSNDNLTINTLEGVYGQESSFGVLMGIRGSSQAAGHFHLRPAAAKRYGLIVSKKNDQRFNIDFASSAATRYLKDLDTFFSKNTPLLKDSTTIAVNNSMERQKFVLGAYNAGEGRIASAQALAKNAGKDPRVWAEVKKFLEEAGASEDTANEARQYVEKVLSYEAEFASKSKVNKNVKQKQVRKGKYRCTEGHWRMIDKRPVFICD